MCQVAPCGQVLRSLRSQPTPIPTLSKKCGLGAFLNAQSRGRGGWQPPFSMVSRLGLGQIVTPLRVLT